MREVCAVSRYHRGVDRFVLGWSVFGLLYAVVYVAWMSPTAFLVLNVYGLLSVLLSFSLCIWTWRLGETYAGWMALRRDDDGMQQLAAVMGVEIRPGSDAF